MSKIEVHGEIGIRGSGRTTRQMKAAKKNSIFIWCNDHLSFAKALARQISRQDLVLHRLSILDDPCQLRGLKVANLVVDHAAELTPAQTKNLSVLMVQAA